MTNEAQWQIVRFIFMNSVPAAGALFAHTASGGPLSRRQVGWVTLRVVSMTKADSAATQELLGNFFDKPYE